MTEQEDRPAHIGSYLWNRTTGEMVAEHRLSPDPLMSLGNSSRGSDSPNSKITEFEMHKNTAEV